jgi:predicted transposase/invertase (TIGR01784 family)
MAKQNHPPAKLKIGKFVDPLTDFGFKLLFGSEPNKDLLIAFLNELFRNRKEIIDLTYNKNEHSGPQGDFRKAVYDLTCTGKGGEQFIIEVQRIHQPYFKDRALFYTSRLINGQAPKGKEWDYSLKEVYFIGLMDFSFEGTSRQKFLHRIHLSEENTREVFYKKLGFIFIEITKFNKSEKMLKSDLDRWMYVLKNMSRLEKIPVILRKRIFEKLFHIAAVSNLTKEDYMNYEKDLMNYWDQYAILKAAEEKGIEKGVEEGKAQVVKNLLALDELSISKIANLANVTEAFVLKVKKGIK